VGIRTVGSKEFVRERVGGCREMLGLGSILQGLSVRWTVSKVNQPVVYNSLFAGAFAQAAKSMPTMAKRTTNNGIRHRGYRHMERNGSLQEVSPGIIGGVSHCCNTLSSPRSVRLERLGQRHWGLQSPTWWTGVSSPGSRLTPELPEQAF
jgi:hypothetical protein